MSSTSSSASGASPAVPARSPIGSHVPVAGGLARNGLTYARELGAETVQVFVANPRGWATPPGDPGQDEAFRAECAARSMPVFVHAPYLINFGSHSPATVDLSVASLRHSLRRARAIGARGVVVHTGSATGGGQRSAVLAQVRRRMLPLLDELAEECGDGRAGRTAGPGGVGGTGGDEGPYLLLEPTAGQGSSLCSRVGELGPYFDALDHHSRLGVCLDTCHVFAAGHDLAAPGGVKQTLDALVDTVGEGRLRLVHANDSKEPAGSRRDRHANIGAGQIGSRAFQELFTHPESAGVPLTIETPGPKEQHARDVAALKELRDTC